MSKRIGSEFTGRKPGQNIERHENNGAGRPVKPRSVIPVNQDLTVDQLKLLLPKGKARIATQQLLDDINGSINSSEFRDEFRDNFISYLSVMGDGRFKITDYLNAIKFCSLKLMGRTNSQSYTAVFPERYQHYLDSGWSSRDIAGVMSMYSRGKLVTAIMNQSLVPHYLLNMDMYQQALNVQTELMLGAKSEKVRSDAANSIMTHLKAPEAIEIDVTVDIKEDDSIKELRDSTMELVRKQKEMIELGLLSPREVAHSKLNVINVQDAVVVDAVIDTD